MRPGVPGAREAGAGGAVAAPGSPAPRRASRLPGSPPGAPPSSGRARRRRSGATVPDGRGGCCWRASRGSSFHVAVPGKSWHGWRGHAGLRPRHAGTGGAGRPAPHRRSRRCPGSLIAGAGGVVREPVGVPAPATSEPGVPRIGAVSGPGSRWAIREPVGPIAGARARVRAGSRSDITRLPDRRCRSIPAGAGRASPALAPRSRGRWAVKPSMVGAGRGLWSRKRDGSGSRATFGQLPGNFWAAEICPDLGLGRVGSFSP